MTLRQRRQQMKLTIDELSRRSGVERSRISRAERGYVLLHEEEIKSLAKHVGATATTLIVYTAP